MSAKLKRPAKPTSKPVAAKPAAPSRPSGPPPDLTGFLTGDLGPVKPKAPKVVPVEAPAFVATSRAFGDPAPVEMAEAPAGPGIQRANCDPPSRT